MSYNSNYTGTQVENRLKQGYYEDIIAQGVAAGYYTEDEVPTKEELDAKLANPELGGGIDGKRYLLDVEFNSVSGSDDLDVFFDNIVSYYNGKTQNTFNLVEKASKLFSEKGITQFYTTYALKYRLYTYFIDYNQWINTCFSGDCSNNYSIYIYMPGYERKIHLHGSGSLNSLDDITSSDIPYYTSINTSFADVVSSTGGQRYLFKDGYFPTNVATIDELKEYIDSLGNDYKYHLASKIKDLFTNYNVTELYSIQKNKNGFEEINNTLFIDVSFDYKYDDAGTIHSWEYITLSIYDPKQPGRILKVKTIFDYYDEGTGSETDGSTTTEIVEYSTETPVPGNQHLIPNEYTSFIQDDTSGPFSECAKIEKIYNFINDDIENNNSTKTKNLIDYAILKFNESGITDFYTIRESYYYSSTSHSYININMELSASQMRVLSDKPYLFYNLKIYDSLCNKYVCIIKRINGLGESINLKYINTSTVEEVGIDTKLITSSNNGEIFYFEPVYYDFNSKKKLIKFVSQSSEIATIYIAKKDSENTIPITINPDEEIFIELIFVNGGIYVNRLYLDELS